MSLRDMDTVFMKGRGFDEVFAKGAIRELLEALDFLHTEVQTVHTGTYPSSHPVQTCRRTSIPCNSVEANKCKIQMFTQVTGSSV